MNLSTGFYLRPDSVKKLFNRIVSNVFLDPQKPVPVMRVLEFTEFLAQPFFFGRIN